MASALRQNYTTGDDVSAMIYGLTWEAQTFTVVDAHAIDQVDLYMEKTGTPTGVLTIAIYATSSSLPTGSALVSTTKNEADFAAGPEWVTFTFTTPYNLSAGTEYAIVAHNANTGDGSNRIGWRLDNNDGTYTTGERARSTNGGSSWTAQTNDDLLFKEYGGFSASGATPTDKTYSRKLVAIGNNEVWYESTAGTMSEITAAKSDIDVTHPLTITEAYQKVFIANKTNLKIADFINTKLTVTALDTAPTRGSTVTQATSNATMIVDFVNTAKTEIYGYTTSGTFVTTAGYTLSGGTMSPETRVPTAVNEASTTPHWYDWTVYPGGTTGEMPTSAYLVTLYRGRLVLSGNPNAPHQWYMSKVADPYDWLYSSTVVLSAVAGNNTNAGKIGDIIRAMIPFGDDFLVFGCANSVHVLDGDPLADGSIDKLSDDTGIFSFTSWCKDDADNLYFYGNHGIYAMVGGRGKPTNISKSVLPNLASDWAVDPTLHRVVMSYDAANRGVMIVKTTLADGTCSGYFYSLDTQGFYPISFGNTADGIYCSFDYNADDPSYRKLLFGCYDGYLRKLLGTNKNDDYGASSTMAISSYFGIISRLSEDSDKDAKLTSLTVEMAGGAAAGSFTDSDGCSYEIHTGDDAETVLEDLKDGATAGFTGTLSGTGRKNRIRNKVRAAWLALKFYNSTTSETFGINNVFGDVKNAGRIK